jgi:hypothetical protein
MTRVQTHSHEPLIGDQAALQFSVGELQHRSRSGRWITRRSESNNARIVATQGYKPATNIPLREILLLHAGPRVLSMQGRSCGWEGRTPLRAGEFNR